MSGSASQAQQLAQQNAIARQLIQAQGLEMVQQIYSGTVTPSAQPIFNIQPRNVGLLRGFWIEVAAKMHDPNASGTPTPFSFANLLSTIAFYDLNNNLRHNTTGWHVKMIDTVRKGYPYLAGFTTPSNALYGGNAWSTFNDVAAATLPTTAPASPNVRCLYYVPISYTKDDLRGAVYAGVTNATMNLQLSLNYQGFSVANTGDPVNAVYQDQSGASTAVWDSATVTVYQDYIDQLPVGSNGAPILPLTDLSTVYELKNTSLTGLSVGQDFPVPYANFRSFLSTFFVYDNPTGTPVVSMNHGADINAIRLQAANFTNIINVDPYLFQSWSNDNVMADAPAGLYYLDTRRKPLNTNQYGNLELVINPSVVHAGASLLMGYEDFAIINTIQLAGSLPGS